MCYLDSCLSHEGSVVMIVPVLQMCWWAWKISRDWPDYVHQSHVTHVTVMWLTTWRYTEGSDTSRNRVRDFEITWFLNPISDFKFWFLISDWNFTMYLNTEIHILFDALYFATSKGTSRGTWSWTSQALEYLISGIHCKPSATLKFRQNYRLYRTRELQSHSKD